ncbi:hypothetical protein VTN77DRAFT_1026 [Rasamsonia byssochlamydoides]|uniref:uncharacterized protein n=1 Tax=Rasamsonia byssochlamydoides TaxID=89139 RepID=UPI0037429992
MFLFSSLLGTHLLCDVLRYPGNDFEAFLSKFVDYLCLLRGVRAIISDRWHILRQTEFRPIFDAAEASIPSQIPEGNCRHKVCDTLKVLIKFLASSLDELSFDACRQAIELLMSIFHAFRTPPKSSEGSTNAIFAWPVLVPAEYAGLLRERNPGALIILAHYAVLLHYHRDIWIFGDGGKFLIRSVTGYLGMDWKQWLAWPNHALTDVLEALHLKHKDPGKSRDHRQELVCQLTLLIKNQE